MSPRVLRIVLKSMSSSQTVARFVSILHYSIYYTNTKLFFRHVLVIVDSCRLTWKSTKMEKRCLFTLSSSRLFFTPLYEHSYE